MKRVALAITLTLGVTAICLIVIMGLGVLLQGAGGAEVWEIPGGYRGWVVAEFNRAHCPDARVTGSSWVYSVSPSGQACTSGASRKGWMYTRYEYVFSDGTRTPLSVGVWGRGGDIWGRSGGPGPQQEMFFVGTEGSFLASSRPQSHE